MMPAGCGNQPLARMLPADGAHAAVANGDHERIHGHAARHADLEQGHARADSLSAPNPNGLPPRQRYHRPVRAGRGYQPMACMMP